MNLKQTISINKRIMKLIRSKYTEVFPNGYDTPESRYYCRLKQDTEKAEKYESMESSRVQSRREAWW